MASGRDQLAESLLHVFRIIGVVLLGGEMNNVPGSVVMRDPDAVPTDRNEAFRHLLEEAVHIHPGPLVIVTVHPAGLCGAVLLHRLLEGFFGGQRKRRLLDVE